MKKILSLSLVALLTLSASAQVQHQADVLKSNKVQKYSLNKRATAIATSELAISPKKVTAAEVDTFMYNNPVGSFYAGITPQFGVYSPIIIIDTIDPVFPNVSKLYSNNPIYWFIETSQGYYYEEAWDIASNEPIDFQFGVKCEAGDMYYVPFLGTMNEEQTQIVPQYKYSNKAGDSYIACRPFDYDENDNVIGAATFPFSTSPIYGNGDNDLWMMAATGLGDYCWGTKLTNPYGTGSDFFDTLAVVFDSRSTIWMDTVIIPIYSNAANQGAIIPADASFTIDVIPAEWNDDAGHYYFDMESIITSVTVTQADLVDIEDIGDGTLAGTISVPFGTTNALGGFTPTPITITGGFAIRMSGFTKNGCNFGIYSSHNYIPQVESTYYFFDGYMSSLWQNPSNVAISVNAKFVDPDENSGNNGGQTSVEDVHTANNVQKVVVDGQVLIQKDGKTYNVLGAEVK